SAPAKVAPYYGRRKRIWKPPITRSEEHTSELQSHVNLVCRLLLEKKERRDRKSTRPNSSHMSISYAVFCLKKKKKNERKNHTAHRMVEVDSRNPYRRLD